MAPPISENACFVPEAGRSHVVGGGADGGQWDTGIGIQCPGRPGTGQETQRERGETDWRRTSILNGCCFAIWGQRGSHGVRYEGLSLLQASGQG